MPRDKSRSRYRRSSTESSDSYERKKFKSKHKKRSRSRDRQDSSYKKRRSVSRSGHRRRSYSRSPSRDYYESKSSSKSRSKKSYKRSVSRERSNSKSTLKYTKSKHKSSYRSRSISSSSRSSTEIERPIINTKVNLDDTEIKVEKAIKAAAAAGLTMTKLPTYEFKSVDVKEDMPTIQDRNLLAELNSDTFVPKSYTSSRNKKFSQNIIIDLDTDTVKVSEPDVVKDDSILDFSVIPSEEELREMWIKKLYNFRKKMLKGEL